MNLATLLARTYLFFSRPIHRRGFYSFMRLVRWAFPVSSRAECRKIAEEGSVFLFPAGDSYWLSLFETGGRYEPELECLIVRLCRLPILFLDCGANFGYWSVKSSTRTRKTIAIEASGETYEWLLRNCRANGNRFVTLRCAVSDGTQTTVSFQTSGSHAGRSIVNDNAVASATTESVTAITVDDLVSRHAESTDLIFVKLDVEGAEIAAFEGAASAFEGRSIFFYEDHGKDRRSSVTAYLIERGRKVYFPAADGTLLPIRSAMDATAVKLRRTTGYNFVTFGREFEMQWLSDLLPNGVGAD